MFAVTDGSRHPIYRVILSVAGTRIAKLRPGVVQIRKTLSILIWCGLRLFWATRSTRQGQPSGLDAPDCCDFCDVSVVVFASEIGFVLGKLGEATYSSTN